MWLDLGYLFIHLRSPCGRLGPSPTACISLPSVLVPFHAGGPSSGGWRKEQQGSRGFSSVCDSTEINTACIPPDCPPV